MPIIAAVIGDLIVWWCEIMSAWTMPALSCNCAHTVVDSTRHVGSLAGGWMTDVDDTKRSTNRPRNHNGGIAEGFDAFDELSTIGVRPDMSAYLSSTLGGDEGFASDESADSSSDSGEGPAIHEAPSLLADRVPSPSSRPPPAPLPDFDDEPTAIMPPLSSEFRRALCRSEPEIASLETSMSATETPIGETLVAPVSPSLRPTSASVTSSAAMRTGSRWLLALLGATVLGATLWVLRVSDEPGYEPSQAAAPRTVSTVVESPPRITE